MYGYFPQSGDVLPAGSTHSAPQEHPTSSGPAKRELLKKQWEVKSSHSSVSLARKSILTSAQAPLADWHRLWRCSVVVFNI